MKKPPTQPELFGRDLASAQPRGVRKLSAATLRAIDTMRRYGFAVSRAGAQHLCRRRAASYQLDDRQIIRMAAALAAAGPPPSVKPPPGPGSPRPCVGAKTAPQKARDDELPFSRLRQ